MFDIKTILKLREQKKEKKQFEFDVKNMKNKYINKRKSYGTGRYYNNCTYDGYGNLHSYNDKPAKTENGVKYWYKHGRLHRGNDLPAEISPTGNKSWYWEGRLHRIGNPAHISGGSISYYCNGELHRFDGPATSHCGLHKRYYLRGKLIKTEEYRECLWISKKKRINVK